MLSTFSLCVLVLSRRKDVMIHFATGEEQPIYSLVLVVYVEFELAFLSCY